MTEFLFPILIFCALFFMLWEITGSRSYSLGAAFVLMLFPQAALLIPPSSLSELSVFVSYFIPFTSEIVVPDLTYLGREAFIPGAPFFLAFLVFVYRALVREASTRSGIVLAGVFYGSLFYLYFYYWVFATIFLALLTGGCLIAREFLRVRRVAGVAILGTLLSIPYWVSFFALRELPHYQEIIERIGLEVGYEPKLFLWKTYALFALLAALALRLWRLETPKALFAAALALSGIVALNVNVVTGIVPQSDHWSGRVFLVTNGILFAVFLYALFKRYQARIPSRGITALAVAGFCGLSLLGATVFLGQFEHSKAGANRHTLSFGLYEAYEWMNANTPKDSVIVSPALQTNIDIPVYTHGRILFARGFTSAASEQELIDRMYTAHKFFGVTDREFKVRVMAPELIYYVFAERYRSRAYDAHLRPWKYERYVLPESLTEEIVQGYAQFELPKNISYRADYLFFGPRERALGFSDEFLKKHVVVYEGAGVRIYKAN